MPEQFVVSARKYRPDNFNELLGQEAISITLRRAILHHKTAHAYLFCGPRGVGKTSAARIFAKTINCTNPTSEGEACGTCESCKAFEEQRSLNIFELDAASNNSTDDIRRLIDEVSVPPQFGKYKVYIIDEVHMLSQSAFNAFLKTLEEPPSYVVFILATTEKQKILPTILSRCQVYDFKPISVETIMQQLQKVADAEQIPAENKALELIAKQADGGMRDALSLFDRIAGFGNGEITYEVAVQSLHILSDSYYTRFTELIYNNDTAALLYMFDELMSKGFDAKTVLIGLQEFFRKLLLASDNTTISLANFTPEELPKLSKLAQDLGKAFIYRALIKLVEAEKNYRKSSAKRLLVEMTLISLTAFGEATTRVVPTPSTPRPHINVTSNTQMGTTATNSHTQASTPSPSTPLRNTTTPTQKLPQTNNIVSEAPKVSPQGSLRSRSSSGVISLKNLATGNKINQPTTNIASTQSNSELQTTTTNTIPKSEHVTATKNIATTDSELKLAWNSYLEENKNSIGRIKLMLLSGRNPRFTDSSNFMVNVASNLEKEELEEEATKLLPYLRNKLSLPQLQMQIEIKEEENTGKTIKTNTQWIADEVEANPTLKRLFDGLDLREI